MKKIILSVAVFLMSILVFGQSKINMSYNGMENNSQVFKFPKTSSKKIYQNLLLFINKSYKNPDNILKSKIENKYIKISAISDDCVWYKYKSYDLKSEIQDYSNFNYTIEINIKDFKIQLNVLECNRNYILIENDELSSFPELNNGRDFFSGIGIEIEKKTETRLDLEKCLNKIIDNIILGVKTKSDF